MSIGVTCSVYKKEYIDRVVLNIKNSALKVSSDFNAMHDASLLHPNYVRNVYIKRRPDIESSFSDFSRGLYPASTCPYFIWKDSNFRISWEYLRRSSGYREAWHRLDQLLISFSEVTGRKVFYQNDSIDDVSGLNEFILSRYEIIDEIKDKSSRIGTEKLSMRMELSDLEAEILRIEEGLRHHFKIHDKNLPHYLEGRHPTFCGSARAPEVIFNKKAGEEPIDFIEDYGVDFHDEGIIVFLRRNEILSTQIDMLVEKMPRYFHYTKDEVRRNIRFRDDLHCIYIEILENLTRGHQINSELARKIYPTAESSSAVKRLEKAALAAKEFGEDLYIALAYQPFHKSTARKYRQ